MTSHRSVDRREAPFAVELDGVGKRYWKLEEQAMLLRSLLPFTRPKRTELWALRNLDLKVEPGETVGILGRNGAGKTSLLRLLAGVSQPSEGTIRTVGRVAPLIGVGVGFHLEMSGRENVYVNGMLLGLTTDEIVDRFDDIVAFAELEDFIDTPVKFYSSGMLLRLGFSVAVHVDPEILLVDEILAVGDIAFQLKCFERMRTIQRRGTTILLVSHSMHAIRLLCPRALLIRRGQLEFDGEAEGAIALHHELLSAPEDGSLSAAAGGATLIRRELIGPDGPTNILSAADTMRLQLTVRFDRDVDSPQILFHVVSEEGTLAYEMKTALGRPYETIGAGEQRTVEIEFLPRLGGGSYRLRTTVTDRDGRAVLWADADGLLAYIVPPLGSAGIADLSATISIDGTVLTNHESMSLGAAADRPGAAPGEPGPVPPTTRRPGVHP